MTNKKLYQTKGNVLYYVNRVNLSAEPKVLKTFDAPITALDAEAGSTTSMKRLGVGLENGDVYIPTSYLSTYT